MLKVNKLDQFIKKSNPLYWGVKDGFNYISNEFSIMKIKDIPEQIKFRLLTLFKEIPENGTALKYDGFGVAKDGAVFKLLENIENCNTVSAIDTELVWATVEIRKTKGVRIFKAGNHAVDIIRDDFLAMVSFSSGIEIHCNQDIQYESLILILNTPLVRKLLSDLQELYTKNNGSFKTIKMEDKI